MDVKFVQMKEEEFAVKQFQVQSHHKNNKYAYALNVHRFNIGMQ